MLTIGKKSKEKDIKSINEEIEQLQKHKQEIEQQLSLLIIILYVDSL
jgi:septal ring factor EnvC (AmiA/AmiB activator)